jgi:hypothetical protein
MAAGGDKPLSERGFCQRLRSYGVRRLLRSWDFVAAFGGTTVLMLLAVLTGRMSFVTHTVCPELAGIAGGFVGIVLAAVAIMTLSDARFVVSLRRLGVLGRILHAYEVALIASVIAVLSNLVTWGASPGEGLGILAIPSWLSMIGLFVLSWISVFFFSYAALAIAALIPRTLDLAQQWADIANIDDGTSPKQ